MQNSNSISNTVYLTHAVDLTIGRRDITGPNQINSWALNTSQDPLMKFKMGLSPWQARHKKTVQLIAPNTVFREDYSQTNTPIQFVYCTFKAEEPFWLRKLIGPFGYAMIDDPNNLVLSIIKEIAKTYNEFGSQGWFKNQSNLYALMDILMNVKETTIPYHWQFCQEKLYIADQDFVKRVQEKMWPKRFEVINIDELADSLIVSRSTLCHKYKKYAGETLIETQIKWRIQEAKKLLMMRHPIKTVASHLGFCDSYYFSKVFKNETGLCPRDYRNQKQ
jgi:AraC-like DNA-binding protein